jgi:hypothetical protein
VVVTWFICDHEWVERVFSSTRSEVEHVCCGNMIGMMTGALSVGRNTCLLSDRQVCSSRVPTGH